MTKINQKRFPIAFTLNQEIYNKFREMCDKKHINRSRLIESFIIEYLNKEEENMQSQIIKSSL